MDPFREERRQQRIHFLLGIAFVVTTYLLLPTLVAFVIWKYLVPLVKPLLQ